ncbi:hypothetical protein HMF8227_00714 [Saliniradius amylolyticus]|uniref:Type II secretion system protein K n=1 Tax=Saliniradius amylolyticus TaxID=2183582 RepID=A0A2S2E1S2_9ALTE|nr:hypothetical protein [Saliniradius amylolyticus]AWL11210.1 hypothetical protein HMF8227_00714 [Saliniradius amylolyticus]
MDERIQQKQAGVALVQVLLITGIILLLVIQLTKDTQSQLRSAQLWQDKVSAELALNNAIERTLFDIMTKERVKGSGSEIQRQWNFFSSPFEIEVGGEKGRVQRTVQLRLQDMAGLASLMYSPDIIEKLLLQQSLSPAESRQLISLLQQWQGVETPSASEARGSFRGPIQFFGELDYISPGLEALLAKRFVTYLPVDYFNPGTLPKELLALIAPNDSLDNLLARRLSGKLDEREFRALSGIDSMDSVSFYPSEMIAINAAVNTGDFRVSKNITIKLQPDREPPIVFLE